MAVGGGGWRPRRLEALGADRSCRPLRRPAGSRTPGVIGARKVRGQTSISASQCDAATGKSGRRVSIGEDVEAQSENELRGRCNRKGPSRPVSAAQHFLQYLRGQALARTELSICSAPRSLSAPKLPQRSIICGILLARGLRRRSVARRFSTVTPPGKIDWHAKTQRLSHHRKQTARPKVLLKSPRQRFQSSHCIYTLSELSEPVVQSTLAFLAFLPSASDIGYAGLLPP